MDRSKLIQIIEKELEELKVLTEEVAASEKDTSLIIEIALSKARLLSQEMELLRELSAKDKPLSEINNIQPEPEEEESEEDVDEVVEESISDPELEIINSEDEIEFDNVTLDDDLEEEEEEIAEEEEDFIEDEQPVDESDEELIEFGHSLDEPVFENEIIEPEEEVAAPQATAMREIEFDEEEEIEPVKAPVTPPAPEKPIFREIPKPEPTPAPKATTGDTFVKNQTLNDSISETKSPETTLSGSISSLKAAIGLNDRFLFIREIFGNNTEKYNMIIDQLDKLETQQQAVELLKKHLTLQKNETSMKFVDLLKRRFAK